MLDGHEVLVLKNTCLDPELHNLEATGARVRCFPGSLNELAPAVMNGEAETTILDLPDAFIALEKWPGKIKIIGPISEHTGYGLRFREVFRRVVRSFQPVFRAMQEGWHLHAAGGQVLP